MKRDPELARLLGQARGVFLVPNYGRGAALVGASGGEGLLLARSDGGWSGPAFYDVGSISVGAQLGASGGAIAMLLMNQEALDRFRSDQSFSLGADADVTLLDYSARAQADLGEADVVLWSDAEGAFAGASLRVSDIDWDEDQNHGFYDRSATPEAILSGRMKSDEAESLRQKLTG
jgi:lipid-binding SYLF domain-containing protein